MLYIILSDVRLLVQHIFRARKHFFRKNRKNNVIFS